MAKKKSRKNEKKQFAPLPGPVRPLAKGRGGCIATDMITVDGLPVGYMYRVEPTNHIDSGWVFTSGRESQAYMDDAGNHGVYDVNTIANYDPDIVAFLDAPAGTAFERQGGSFEQVDGEPWDPNVKPAKRWPPPGFPLVEGEHPLTATWSIHLPEQFARRIEDRSLVLWRPGLTIWLTAWNNDKGESRAKRLAWIKGSASPDRFAERESSEADDGVTRFSYRLRDESENGPVESVYGFVLNDSGHLQLSIYFDDPADEEKARQLVESVTTRRTSGAT